MTPSSYWLSYGGGVNSTALTILLVRGKLPQYAPWRIVMADTGDEKDRTYAYIRDVFGPWLEQHGKALEIAKPKETVLGRWQRLNVTGSRIIRACSIEGKIKPIEKHIAANGGSLGQLIGIDAGEAHRAKDRPGKFYPLVDLDIDRDECEAIIKAEGMPSPGKSGCWHCPFMRVGEVIELVKTDPCKVAMIERLENAATELHGKTPDGNQRTQWGEYPVSWWRKRSEQGDLFIPERDPSEPCECYDGG